MKELKDKEMHVHIPILFPQQEKETNGPETIAALRALGYSERHVYDLIEAEKDKREKAKEETFREETEKILKRMET